MQHTPLSILFPFFSRLVASMQIKGEHQLNKNHHWISHKSENPNYVSFFSKNVCTEMQKDSLNGRQTQLVHQLQIKIERKKKRLKLQKEVSVKLPWLQCSSKLCQSLLSNLSKSCSEQRYINLKCQSHLYFSRKQRTQGKPQTLHAAKQKMDAQSSLKYLWGRTWSDE